MAKSHPPPPRASSLPPKAMPTTDEFERLWRRSRKLTSLLEVAKAMTVERNLDHLLDLILTESVRTVDAERGSLFIMDRKRNELWSKISHGLEAKEIRLPVSSGIAGQVAATRRPMNIPDAYADPRFNREVDTLTGYRTATILCVPMLGSKQETVGVVQALNHRGGPFTAEDEELLMAFGANAAAAIENAGLYEEIERLFEGFVSAAVTAIESRDPTTSGHSGRVADLAVTTMELLPRAGGAYQGLSFSAPELREMRYAALLHDFGKVGVREHVLVKAEKLYPSELQLLEARFAEARRGIEVEILERKVAAFEAHGPERGAKIAAELDLERRRRELELEEMLAFVKKCNRPAVLEEGGFEKLREIGQVRYRVGDCALHLLSDHEVKNLSIPRGSLNPEERREIESHVSHTYSFLRQIPWTRDLARVPDFAHGHHEKLNGKGYPRGVGADAIPLQTRIMTIADIYDALTASDRPYKAAMPHERAVGILEDEARRGHIDPGILGVFIEARVPAIAFRR